MRWRWSCNGARCSNRAQTWPIAVIPRLRVFVTLFSHWRHYLKVGMSNKQPFWNIFVELETYELMSRFEILKITSISAAGNIVMTALNVFRIFAAPFCIIYVSYFLNVCQCSLYTILLSCFVQVRIKGIRNLRSNRTYTIVQNNRF
jgi:hypothetical protein